MVSPESSSSTGTRPSGLRAKCSGVRVSPCEEVDRHALVRAAPAGAAGSGPSCSSPRRGGRTGSRAQPSLSPRAQTNPVLLMAAIAVALPASAGRRGGGAGRAVDHDRPRGGARCGSTCSSSTRRSCAACSRTSGSRGRERVSAMARRDGRRGGRERRLLRAERRPRGRARHRRRAAQRAGGRAQRAARGRGRGARSPRCASAGAVTSTGVTRLHRRGRPHARPGARLRRARRRPADHPAERRAHLHRRERARAALARATARGRRARAGWRRCCATGGWRGSAAPGSGPVPRGALLLTGTGDAARFLRDAALPRSRAEVALTLTAAGRPVDLAQQTLVVGGGPRLLRARARGRDRQGGGLRAAAGAGLLRHLRRRSPAAYARRACGPTARSCS